jgi:lipopolysaccharide assembly outer membrane protein LptD (OstA)
LPSALQKQHFIKNLLLIWFTAAVAFIMPAYGQNTEENSSLEGFKPKKNIAAADSAFKPQTNFNLATDTINHHLDSISLSFQAPMAYDSISPRRKNKTLEAQVKYTARDSMRFEVAKKKMYLYGEAQVDYQNISMKAGYIELDLNTKTVFARGLNDSLGQVEGLPEFTEGTHSFTSKEMKFNFQTKKGLIKDVITKEGDGYIHGKVVKKMDNDEMYIKNGKYTTCDSPEPHFHLHASKLKIIPNDKIITGPAYLSIQDVPTPLALPFGFFPNKAGQASGLIIPQYGESSNQGFFLTNGGYYFALNERMDLSIMGDIYSKGSWAIGGNTNYRKRYKYNGVLDARFSNFKVGESLLRDIINPQTNQPYFTDNRDFMVKWRHTQDPKARPNSIFSADVNVGTSNYNRLNSFGGGANANNFLTNQLSSNIRYTKTWAGTPFNLSLNARHNQNTNTRDVTVTLPEATFTVNRFFPFRRAVQVGGQRWYEKIGVNYTNQISNELTTKDSLIWDANNIRRLRNGMQQASNIETSFRLFKHFTYTPSIAATNRTYLQTLRKRWDTESDSLITDTIGQISNAFEARMVNNITTQIFGMYQFQKGPVQAIRHVLTPQVGFTYRPDFGFEHPVHGYYGNNGTVATYSPYGMGIFGHPQPGAQGLVTFNLMNNLEMKVKSAKDTLTGLKKVKIFEFINISTSHNIFAEEFKWQPLSMNGRTQLFDRISLVFNGNIDPYTLSQDSLPRRLNTMEWNENGRIGRFTDGSLMINFDLRSKNTPPPVVNALPSAFNEMDRIMRNPNDYVDFNIPWNLSVAYVYRYTKPFRDVTHTQTLQFHGDFNLTPKWKFGFNSNYDFTMKELTYTTLNIYRDLHCWEMAFSWIPFGFNRSYNVQINVKSHVLQDLKLIKRSPPFDNR